MSNNEDFTPKLAEDPEKVIPSGVSPKRKASDKLITTIDTAPSEPISRSAVKIVKALLSLIIAGIFTTLSVWTILISTVVATPSVNGVIFAVDRNAWTLGGAKSGDIAYSLEIDQSGLFNKIGGHLNGSVNNGAIIKILGTPLDYINTNIDGYLIINGYSTEILSDRIIDRKQLGDTYLAECLEGSCGIPGTLYEVPIDNVVGSVEGILKFFEIEEYAR